MSQPARDPQLALLMRRIDTFQATVSTHAALLSTVRDDLDGLWVTRRDADDEVTWVFRSRPARRRLRSA